MPTLLSSQIEFVPSVEDRCDSCGAAAKLRFATRLGFALFACAVLLTCSLLLALRRPSDPVVAHLRPRTNVIAVKMIQSRSG